MLKQEELLSARVSMQLIRPWISWLLLGVSVLLFLGLGYLSTVDDAERTKARFALRAEIQKEFLIDRMHDFGLIVESGAALFSSSESVSREEWRKYVAALEVDRNMPGMLGMGYARMLRPEERAHVERQVRAEGFPQFTIHPPGDRSLLSAIIYLEPFSEDNQRAFGFDMFSEPVRQAAMQRACDTGMPALSGKVILVQEGSGQGQPGLLLYMPVYKRGMPTDSVAARRDALQGFIYAAFRARTLLSRIFRSSELDVDVQIFDGERTPGNLLYASEGANRLSKHVTYVTLEVAGHPWNLRINSTPEFESETTSAQPKIILVGGSVFSLMLLLILLMRSRHVRKVESGARDLESSRDELRSASRYFRSLLEASLDPLVTIDADGKISDANLAAEEVTGWNRKDLVGTSFSDYFTDRQRATTGYKLVFLDGKVKDYPLTIKHRSGKLTDVLYNASVYRNEQGQVTGVFAAARDISELKRSQEQLQSTNREIVLLGQMSSLLQSCRTVEESYPIITSTMEKLFPRTGGRLFLMGPSGDMLENVVFWGDFVGMAQPILPDDCWALTRGQIHDFGFEESINPPCRHIEDRLVPYMCIPLQAQGAVLGLIHLLVASGERDESRRQHACQLAKSAAESISLAVANLRLRDSLHLLAIHDPLTGLYNRRFMEEALAREISRMSRARKPLALAMLDIDHFKRFNDTYGHEAGDTVLKAFAAQMAGFRQGSDLACRYGGEEFLLILPELGPEQSMVRLERFRESVGNLSVMFHGQELPRVTVSIGVAFLDEQGDSGEKLIRAADDALYRAKTNGRNRVESASSAPAAAGEG